MINNEQASSNYKLRFLDDLGNSYPDWKKQKIDDIFILQSGLKNKSKDDFLINMNHHFIPFISIFKSKILKDDLRKVFIGTNENQNNVKKNDLILNITSETKEEVGWINLFELDEENIYLNSFSKILRSKNEKLLNSYFLKYMFKSTLVRKKIIELGQGYTRVNLNLKDFMKLDVLLPSLAEQQKIGNHLSNVDYYLQLQQKEIILTKEYKKSLLEQIFNQELRFVDENGNNYPDWEKIKLAEVIIKNKLRNINNSDFIVETISNKFGFIKQSDYFDKDIASINKNNYYVAKQNIIAYNPSRINVGSVALKQTDYNSLISPLYINFYCDTTKLDPTFLINYFKTKVFHFNRLKFTNKGVRENFTWEGLKILNFLLPSLIEQQKIGILLTNIDQQINQLELEYKNLNEYKNILLNKLIF